MIFRSSSFLKRTVCTPEMAFTSVDLLRAGQRCHASAAEQCTAPGAAPRSAGTVQRAPVRHMSDGPDVDRRLPRDDFGRERRELGGVQPLEGLRGQKLAKTWRRAWLVRG